MSARQALLQSIVKLVPKAPAIDSASPDTATAEAPDDSCPTAKRVPTPAIASAATNSEEAPDDDSTWHAHARFLRSHKGLLSGVTILDLSDDNPNRVIGFAGPSYNLPEREASRLATILRSCDLTVRFDTQQRETFLKSARRVLNGGAPDGHRVLPACASAAVFAHCAQPAPSNTLGFTRELDDLSKLSFTLRGAKYMTTHVTQGETVFLRARRLKRRFESFEYEDNELRQADLCTMQVLAAVSVRARVAVVATTALQQDLHRDAAMGYLRKGFWRAPHAPEGRGAEAALRLLEEHAACFLEAAPGAAPARAPPVRATLQRLGRPGRFERFRLTAAESRAAQLQGRSWPPANVSYSVKALAQAAMGGGDQQGGGGGGDGGDRSNKLPPAPSLSARMPPPPPPPPPPLPGSAPSAARAAASPASASPWRRWARGWFGRAPPVPPPLPPPPLPPPPLPVGQSLGLPNAAKRRAELAARLGRSLPPPPPSGRPPRLRNFGGGAIRRQRLPPPFPRAPPTAAKIREARREQQHIAAGLRGAHVAMDTEARANTVQILEEYFYNRSKYGRGLRKPVKSARKTTKGRKRG